MIKPKTSRMIVVAREDDAEPGMWSPTGEQPAGSRVFGDGVGNVSATVAIAYATQERDEAALHGRRVWVWVGHDAAFECDFWRWFACVGPDDWTSPRLEASIRSLARITKARVVEPAAESPNGRKGGK